MQQEKKEFQQADRPPDRPRPASRSELSGWWPAPNPALAGLQAGRLWRGRETSFILIFAVIRQERNLPNRLVSSIDDQEGAATTDIPDFKVGRKFCIITWTIYVSTSH